MKEIHQHPVTCPDTDYLFEKIFGKLSYQKFSFSLSIAAT